VAYGKPRTIRPSIRAAIVAAFVAATSVTIAGDTGDGRPKGTPAIDGERHTRNVILFLGDGLAVC